MNKFWTIFSHTYMTKLKTKSFFFTTAIIVVFLFAFANIQSIIDIFSNEEKDQIAVIDETGQMVTPLQEAVENTNEDMEIISYDGTLEQAKEAIINEEYESLIMIEYNENNLPNVTYYANNLSNTNKQTILEQQLQQIKVGIATQQAGINQEVLAEIYDPIHFSTVSLDESAKSSEEMSQARGIVYVMLFILYIAVLMYGSMIATDVATEKSSRVMELLVSSASPVTHMLAKIFAIALLGLTQIIFILVVAYSLVLSKQDQLTGQGQLTEGFFDYFGFESTSPAIYVYGVIFFLLGYLLYATLAAMLGSLVSRAEEAQQMITPVVFLVVIAFMIAMFGLNMPESTIVTVSSYIPFFSPMLMFLRVGMLEVPFWEVSLSILLLIITIIFFAIIGARVYKGGVLMYGRASSFKDLKKAMALSKKENK